MDMEAHTAQHSIRTSPLRVCTLLTVVRADICACGMRRCRKSIEGVGACFAASFVACAIVAACVPSFPPAAAFTVGQVSRCYLLRGLGSSHSAYTDPALAASPPHRTVLTCMACASRLCVDDYMDR